MFIVDAHRNTRYIAVHKIHNTIWNSELQGHETKVFMMGVPNKPKYPVYRPLTFHKLTVKSLSIKCGTYVGNAAKSLHDMWSFNGTLQYANHLESNMISDIVYSSSLMREQ